MSKKKEYVVLLFYRTPTDKRKIFRIISADKVNNTGGSRVFSSIKEAEAFIKASAEYNPETDVILPNK